jgi:hypothetical protein
MRDCKHNNLWPVIKYVRDSRSDAYSWFIGVWTDQDTYCGNTCVAGRDMEPHVSLKKAMRCTIDRFRQSAYRFTPLPSAISSELDGAVRDLSGEVERKDAHFEIGCGMTTGYPASWFIAQEDRDALPFHGVLWESRSTLREALSAMRKKRKAAARNRPKQESRA